MQADAERGVVECRMCRRAEPIDQAITLWRNGALIFSVCDRCSGAHDIVMRPVEAGIEVRAKRRGPLIVRGGSV